MGDIVKKEENAISMYHNAVNIGTENMSQEDINTPVLKIIQSTSQDEIEGRKIGSFYRTDIKEQFDSVRVNLVFVSTSETQNYNKTGIEKVKVYFGFYENTNEPFKMFLRGWGIASHRDFQTEIFAIKNKYKVPMLALTIELTTDKQSGTIQDTGKPYTIYKPVFNIVKGDGEPVIEMNPDRISFLVEAVERFKNIATTSDNDDLQNQVDEGQKIADEVPF